MVKKSDGKESTCNAGDWVQFLGQEDSLGKGRRKWLPTPVFLHGKFNGQNSLADYSLWGHKETWLNN